MKRKRKPSRTAPRVIPAPEPAPQPGPAPVPALFPGVELPPDTPETGQRDDHGLSARERLFIQSLLKHGDRRTAVKEAGYSASDKNVMDVQAFRLLRRPWVQEEIARILAEQRQGQDWIKGSIIDVARSSMAEFLAVGDDGEVRLDLLRAAGLGALGHVKKYEEEILPAPGEDKGGAGSVVLRRKIEIHDRLPALKLLADLEGMIVNKQEISGKDGGPVLVLDVNLEEPKPENQP